MSDIDEMKLVCPGCKAGRPVPYDDAYAKDCERHFHMPDPLHACIEVMMCNCGALSYRHAGDRGQFGSMSRGLRMYLIDNYPDVAEHVEFSMYMVEHLRKQRNLMQDTIINEVVDAGMDNWSWGVVAAVRKLEDMGFHIHPEHLAEIDKDK